AVAQRLAADTTHEIKAILVVQIDTASSVVNDIAAIRRAIDSVKHPALLLVDAVASLGCMPFEMDEWGVDVAMAGSQKGLMTPPGLSFVAAGPRAREAHKTAGMRTPYWDWTFRDGDVHYHKYCGTPPEHLLFALRAALDMLFAEGREATFHRHRLLAEGARRARHPARKRRRAGGGGVSGEECAGLDLSFVMPGLVPGIHACLSDKDVDGRVKPGHDGAGSSSLSLRSCPLLRSSPRLNAPY